jgi:threonine dehydrogenase-like Zn-dependent dehydrogenase
MFQNQKNILFILLSFLEIFTNLTFSLSLKMYRLCHKIDAPVKGIHLMLRDMIIGGKAKLSFIVSHRISLDEVSDAYREFDQRTNGYTKVIIKPQK